MAAGVISHIVSTCIEYKTRQYNEFDDGVGV